MEKFKCPHSEVIVNAEYIRKSCVARCEWERLRKCLEEAENNEKKDEVVTEPFVIGKWLLEGGKRCKG